jgi:hypothetical protein
MSPFDVNQGAQSQYPRLKTLGLSIILSHPDYDRRLRNLTGSADPVNRYLKALAGSALTLTAGGELHPALRTLYSIDNLKSFLKFTKCIGLGQVRLLDFHSFILRYAHCGF